MWACFPKYTSFILEMCVWGTFRAWGCVFPFKILLSVLCFFLSLFLFCSSLIAFWLKWVPLFSYALGNSVSLFVSNLLAERCWVMKTEGKKKMEPSNKNTFIFLTLLILCISFLSSTEDWKIWVCLVFLWWRLFHTFSHPSALFFW